MKRRELSSCLFKGCSQIGRSRGNFPRRNALTGMDYETVEKRPLTKEERDAKKELARIAAEKNLAEREKADQAFRSNFEALKAERKAREQQEKTTGQQ